MGFFDDQVVPLIDLGLGNSSYLVDLGDGRGLTVDASLDLRAVREAAAERGLRVAFAADTHLHADFLSGSIQLAHEAGARVLASAAGRRRFPHTALTDGDDVDLGGLTLRALSTPGHTDEHVSFLLLDGGRELGVFTGGSLIVGSAARTDLLSAARAEDLARAQYRSVHRLLMLPDATPVWPTHGAGSFCSAPPGVERTSTIGAERATNSLLAAPDEDTFVAALLGSLGSYPAYFAALGEVNRRGPELLRADPELASLTVPTVRQEIRSGSVVVDARPVAEYAVGHIPGSISIALRDQFATWLGWVVPTDARLVLVLGPGQDPAEVAWQAAKIGVNRIAGYLDGGMASWRDAGGAQQRIALVPPSDIGGRPVIDVRQDSEWVASHVPGAAHVELGELAASSGAGSDGAVVMCGHGERAMTAASLLARDGTTGLAVLDGGPEDWARASGRNLASGG